jgi:RNA-dependent RNA polymerase
MPRPRVHPGHTPQGEQGPSPTRTSKPSVSTVHTPPSKRRMENGGKSSRPSREPQTPSLRSPQYPHESQWKAKNPNSGVNGTSKARFKGSRRTPEHDSPVATSQDWLEWPNVKIRVHGLQTGLGAHDVHSALSKHGFVHRIGYDRGTNSVFVTLFPPPMESFWSRGKIRVGNRNHHISLVPYSWSTVKSPLNPKINHLAFVNVYAQELTFGVMTAESTMMQMQTIHGRVETDSVIQLNIRKQELDIRFPYPGVETSRRSLHGRFRVAFRDLIEVQSIETDGQVAMAFTLQTPPEFYKQLDKADIPFDDYAPVWNEWCSWSRHTELVHPGFEAEFKTSPLRLRTEHAVIDFGRWLTYHFVLAQNTKEYSQILSALSDFNIRVNHLDAADFTIVPRKDASIWSHLELSSTHATITAGKLSQFLSGMSEMQSGLSHLPFPVLWQLMVCISRGYLNEFNMDQEFLQKLNDIGELTAQGLLEYIADRKLRFHDPMKIFSLAQPNPRPKHIPPYCSLLYACNVTPTTIYFSSPQVEISNRVIRKNSEYQDRFLRVRITEENSGRIHSQADSSNDDMFGRVRRFLKYGLVLGDRHYEFLAFGNSQFREHGLYCFASIKGLAEIPDMTASDIRSQLGDFSHIRVPAKLAARLGQNFSTTRNFGTSVTIVRIPDIERNNYNFSDGVGMMSPFVASMVGMEFGRPADEPPSVIQFRLGGCKGILAIAPELQGREIQIRESQDKFDSKSTVLEIIRPSTFVTATLNRQLIILLSSLGVKDQVFTGKLRKMLFDYEAAMSDPDVACRLLTKNIDFNHMTLTMANMINDGFMECQDPFMISMLRLWRSWTIKYLKEKAKILVDKGACLFGCVDEYGVLEGHFDANQQLPPDASREARISKLPQIYVQIDMEGDGRYQALEGICCIYRNPSLHPGDVRVVHAVDRPQLRYLKDVLVLPQTGDRDLGNMCSGGDLDGDDYLVIWDETLFPPIEEWNNPPMDFTAHPPKPLNRDVIVDDISEFFIQYMKNDQLPTIAHAHLCWADTASDGVKDPRCLALAQLHSHAVDYPKNGEPAQIQRNLRPRMWPHFMEKKHKSPDQIYHSKKVLGQLYDMIERIDFVPVWNKPFDKRILNAFEIPDWMLLKATEIKRDYDTAIRRVMAQLGIATEFEVFSAFAMSFNREKKEFTLAEELGAITNAHKNRFREACIKAAGGQSFSEFGPFLVAMYKTTEQEVQAALTARDQGPPTGPAAEVDNMDDMPLISFPWIFNRELGLIATGNFKGEQQITIPLTTHSHRARPKRKSLPLMEKDGSTSSPAEFSTKFDIPIIVVPTQIGKVFAPKSIVQPPEASRVDTEQTAKQDLFKAKEFAVSSTPSPIITELRSGSPLSRAASPFSQPPSESTARELTPPSSVGGPDEEEYDEAYDTEVDDIAESMMDRLHALMEDM